MDNYRINIKEKDGLFYLWCEELGIVVSGQDIAEAYVKLKDAIALRQENYQKLGLDLPKSQADNLKQKIIPFAIKTAITALALVVVMGSVSISFTYMLREPLSKAGLKLGRAAIQNFTVNMEKGLKEELSPEKEAEIRKVIRQAVPFLRPFAEELRPLFADNQGQNLPK